VNGIKQHISFMQLCTAHTVLLSQRILSHLTNFGNIWSKVILWRIWQFIKISKRHKLQVLHSCLYISN